MLFFILIYTDLYWFILMWRNDHVSGLRSAPGSSLRMSLPSLPPLPSLMSLPSLTSLTSLTPTFHVQRLSSKRFSTTVAEISRFPASSMTRERGPSMTSSVTIIPRLTGRQCMKWASRVTSM